MDDIILQWADYLKTIKRYSPHTLTAYLQDLRQFVGFLQNYKGNEIKLIDLEALSLRDLRAWLSDRLSQGFSLRSTTRAISTCRSFFKFLSRHHNYNVTAITLLESPKLKRTLPRPLTEEQTDTLLSEIEDHATELWVGLRDRAFFTLLYATGMRISEALSLKGDVLQVKDRMSVVGKGGKTRVIPLMPAVHEAIADYIKSCPYPIIDSTPLFLGLRGNRLSVSVAQKALRLYRQRTGLPVSVTPHALRHSCATHLMQESSDLRGIQELLGHASLSSTQIYTQLDQRQLMQTFSQAHPRVKNKTP